MLKEGAREQQLKFMEQNRYLYFILFYFWQSFSSFVIGLKQFPLEWPCLTYVASQ